MKSRISSMPAVVASLAGAVVGASWADAQCSPPYRVRANDCDADDRAGYSVGIDGDYMIMGSPYDNEKGYHAGAANVFVRYPWGSWSQQDKLTSQTAYQGDYAGSAVAISGTDAVVGIPRATYDQVPEAGTVALFSRLGDHWYEYDLLRADATENGAKFGSAVAAEDGWIVVGAPQEGGEGGIDSGVVYFFHDAGGGDWSRAAKKYQIGGAFHDEFGAAVAIHGSYAAGGAPGANIPGIPDCGAVTTYFFDGSNWVEKQTFLAPDVDSSDAFGTALAIGDGFLVVGAPRDNVGTASAAGSAYVYELSNGIATFKQKLTNGSGKQDERIGSVVAIAGTQIYLSGGFSSTTILRYELGQNGQWALVEYIVDPDQWWSGHFGASLATDGSRLVVGDDRDDYGELGLVDSGAAYVIDVPPACPADTDGNGVLDLFDFLGFQNWFVAQDTRADLDCSKGYDLFDFLAYQNLFTAGCN